MGKSQSQWQLAHLFMVGLGSLSGAGVRWSEVRSLWWRLLSTEAMAGEDLVDLSLLGRCGIGPLRIIMVVAARPFELLLSQAGCRLVVPGTLSWRWWVGHGVTVFRKLGQQCLAQG